MDEDAYARLAGVEIGAAVARREVSAVDVTRVALARIGRLDGSLCAFLEVWAEEAVDRARAVDRRVAAGERLPLAGVPIGVKGRRGARALAARRLVDAGCVPVGATSVPGPGTAWQTWGQGSGGRTVNPWRHDRTPGGSSAGSAVAVAAGMVPLATGSDGAGSVRIPAAWCGVFGLKLGHGGAGRLVAPGVLARRAEDVAAYVGCVRGATSVRGSLPVAVWSEDLGFAGHEVEPEVAAVARDAAERLAAAGVLRLVRPSAPVRLDDPGPAWLALRTPGADTAAATRIREANHQRLAAFFRDADLLLTPATPNRPHGHEGPGERYSTALTWAFNLSGHPAASIPAGHTADGCPVGLQLVARHGEEALLVDVAREVEQGGRVLA